jgi:hypothetical protein
MNGNLQDLPVWPQSQTPVSSQLSNLYQVANRLGLYDAADAIKQMSRELDQLKYGCHVDLEPDGCVIDTGEHHYCIYAVDGMRKEQCRYWRIVT